MKSSIVPLEATLRNKNIPNAQYGALGSNFKEQRHS